MIRVGIVVVHAALVTDAIALAIDLAVGPWTVPSLADSSDQLESAHTFDLDLMALHAIASDFDHWNLVIDLLNA